MFYRLIQIGTLILTYYILIITYVSEKGTQKGKYKNREIKKFRYREIKNLKYAEMQKMCMVKSRNRIIQKSKNTKMQSLNIKNVYAAFENPKINHLYSYNS